MEPCSQILTSTPVILAFFMFLTRDGHSGITGPWTCVLDPEMLDSGPKGGVHIMGEICPRSDPDIAHMGYYLDPLQLTYSSDKSMCTIPKKTHGPNFVFLGQNFSPESSVFRVQSPGPGSSDSKMPSRCV